MATIGRVCYGRVLAESLNGQVLSSYLYDDEYPVAVTEDRWLDAQSMVTTKSFYDGAGNLIASVSGSSDTQTRRDTFVSRDGSGRVIASYTPRMVTLGSGSYVAFATLEELDPENLTEETFTQTTYDGLGRAQLITEPGGYETQIVQSGPFETVTIDAKGNRTRRKTDFRGRIKTVTHEDASQSVVAAYECHRDGVGRLSQIVDPDGLVRHLSWDKGDRLHKVDVPHVPGATQHVFEFCYDAQDNLQEMTTPEGRTVSYQRDELGRWVAHTASDATGSVSKYASYDDPTQTNSLGRLSKSKDRSGTLSFNYDLAGRPLETHFEPSAFVRDGGNVLNIYSAFFDYTRHGLLNSVEIDASQDGSLARVYYTRNKRDQLTSLYGCDHRP